MAVGRAVDLTIELVREVFVHAGQTCGCVEFQVGLAVQHYSCDIDCGIVVETVALREIGASGVVHDQVREHLVLPVIADSAEDFLGLGGSVALILDPGTLAVGQMGLEMVVVEVAFPIEAGLELEVHPQGVEPVVEVHHLGVNAVPFLIGDQVLLAVGGSNHRVEFRVTEFLLGHLGHLAYVVERHGDVG